MIIYSRSIKDGTSKTITFVDEDDNELTYKARNKSTNGYAAPVTDTWFTAIDNSVAELDEITAASDTNYSVGKLDTSNPLKQSLTTLAYNSKSNKK